MSTPIASVKVTLDKAQAERDASSFSAHVKDAMTPIQGLSASFGKFSSGLSEFGGKASAVWGTIKSAYEGAEAVLQRIVGIYNSDAVAGAVEEERAQLRLATALRLRGEAGAELSSQHAEQAEALERVLGLQAGETVALTSQLVLLGVQTERLQEARNATIGLAEVTGKNLHTAARDVAAVLRGETTRAIKQLGLDGMDAESILARLAGNMGLAEERADSFGGRIERMNANIDDMLEPLGEAVTKSATWSGGLDTLRLSALGVKEVLGDLADTLVNNFLTGAAGDALDYLAAPLRVRGFEAEAEARDKLARATREQSRAEEDRIRAQQAAGGGFVGQLNARVFGGLNFDDDAAVVTGQSDISKQAAARAKVAAKAAKDEADRVWKSGLADYTDTLVGPIDPDLEQFRKADAIQQIAQDSARAHQKALTDIEIAANNQRFDAQLDAFDKREAATREQARKEVAMAGEVAQFSAAAFSSIGASLGNAAASGQDAGDALLGVLGNIVAQLGGALIAFGVTAIAAGTIGTTVPFLGTTLGGPPAIAAGIAAIAVGTALTAGGAYISAQMSGGGGASSGGGGAGNRGRLVDATSGSRTLADQPQSAGARGGGDRNATFIVQVTGGVWGMDSPRALRDLLDQDARRRPVRRGAS